jgi:hypothetical protein
MCVTPDPVGRSHGELSRRGWRVAGPAGRDAYAYACTHKEEEHDDEELAPYGNYTTGVRTSHHVLTMA